MNRTTAFRIIVLALAVVTPAELISGENDLTHLMGSLNPQPVPPEQELQRTDAEISKLRAETQKLKAEEKNLAHQPWYEFGKVALGVLPLAAAVLIAAYQIREQRRSQAQQARVQAQLKAVEIAMNSANRGLVAAKLDVIKKVLPADLLAGLTVEMLEKGPQFGSYVERFLKLLELIAAHPESRQTTVEAYRILLPEDVEPTRRLDELARCFASSEKRCEMPLHPC